MNTVAITTKTLRVDTKGRVSLGKLLHEGVSGFKAFWDDQDRLILEPLVEIPAREKWIYENPETLSRLDKAQQQAKKGQVRSLGNFKAYLDERE